MKRMIYTLCALLLLCSTFLFVSCNDDKSSTTSTPSTPTHVCSGEWSTSEATCTREGSRSRTCPSCGKVETETIPMLDHTYTEDNFCEQCHVMKEGTYTEGLEYTVSGNNCSVSDVGSAENKTEIIIPSYYNGKKVIRINSAAFLGCSNLKSIDIPRTVDEIGEGAFSGCSALETMRIPTIGGDESSYYGLAGYYFGEDSYPNSEQITLYGRFKYQYDYYRTEYTAYVPLSLKTIILTGSTEGDTLGESPYPVGASTRYDCAFTAFPIETLIVESSVTDLEHGFSGCKKLKTVIFEDNCALDTLGDSFLYIGGQGLFENCTALETIVIPNSVKTLGAGCFSGCTNLKNITFSNQLETIEEYCFDNCTSIEKIVFPTTLKAIKGDYDPIDEMATFGNCTSLKEITLPKSLTKIDDRVFYRCFNLKTVYNNSRLYLEKGSESYGYVAYYAETIINE